ncbi:methyltransferase [Streptomyces aurantiacus]|uniref:methyltransferase n=1 Tax=Streptomyces aurantiacus TaxID=47760 RepID=UPI00099F2AF8|nr:methyltransferase [Streptomyces aurantiacus]
MTHDTQATADEHRESTDGSPAAYSFVDPSGISLRQRLMLLANGQRFSAVVYALAEMNVADQLAKGPRTAGELADAVGADETALYRMLRCAALLGVFRELDGRRFALTPLAEGLRTDLPDGVRDAVLLDGSGFFWGAFGSILHSARTGRPGFDAANGMSFWEYLQGHPEAGAVFDDAMTTISRRLGGLYLDRVDFSRFPVLADVGGGRGYFLAEILRRNPDMRGVLFDRPQVTGTAGELLTEREVADRVEVVGGDFFTDSVPAGCDAYVLKTVLHDWPDDKAVAILRRVREAIGDSEARLLVLEQVVAPGNVWDTAKFLDVDMLVVMGGRERNLDEWRALLTAGGFELDCTPAVGDWAVLECRPN